MVLARPVANASLRSAWHDALAAGKLAVVSAAETTHRLTEKYATARNDLAARLVDRIAIAYASPGGQLSQQVEGWRLDGLTVDVIAPPSRAG